MTEEAPLRVLIAGDHEFIRRSLAMLVARRSEFVVVGEVATAAAVKEKAAQDEPDLVIVDVNLPDGSGIEASREITSRNPNTKVLILTPYGDERALVNAVVAGALGYLRKGTQVQEAVEALRMVRRGRPLVNPMLRQQVLDRLRESCREDPQFSLTLEEQEIFQQVVDGKTDRDIAAGFYLTEETVRGHITTILRKLDVIIRTQSASYMVSLRERRSRSA